MLPNIYDMGRHTYSYTQALGLSRCTEICIKQFLILILFALCLSVIIHCCWIFIILRFVCINESSSIPSNMMENPLPLDASLHFFSESITFSHQLRAFVHRISTCCIHVTNVAARLPLFTDTLSHLMIVVSFSRSNHCDKILLQSQTS